MEQQQLDRLRALLDEHRGALEKQMAEIGLSADGEAIEVSTDEGFSDSAHATAERSQLVTLAQQLRHQYRETLDAVTRMDEGVFGKCERCGQEIAFERLEALPAARLCVSCKQR